MPAQAKEFVGLVPPTEKRPTSQFLSPWGGINVGLNSILTVTGVLNDFTDPHGQLRAYDMVMLGRPRPRSTDLGRWSSRASSSSGTVALQSCRHYTAIDWHSTKPVRSSEA